MALIRNAALLISLLAFNLSAQAVDVDQLPQQSAVPGGLTIIDLKQSGDKAPSVTYRDKRVMTVKYNGGWHAVVGIPLSAKSGEHHVETESGDKLAFNVEGKQYEVQRLTIKNKRKVDPNEEDMKRIISEKKEINSALSHWNDTLLAGGIMLDLPLEGRLSSPFGLRRYFNDQPRRPHSGIDIAAPKGTPISAPAAGKIITTGDYFFNGNTVFIDHGMGLVTMYCHMDRIDVKEGQTVERGEQIGTIGMTGRVTGPHLHWGISLNDARVDPMLVVPALQTATEAKTSTDM